MNAKPCLMKSGLQAHLSQMAPKNGAALQSQLRPPAKWPDWLSVKEAAKILGVSSATVRRLRETVDPCSRRPFLLSCKPTPRTILISAASIQEHQQASQQLEFWDARKQVKLCVRPSRRRKKRKGRRANRSTCRRAARNQN